MTTEKIKNIHQRINEVMEVVTYVRKDAKIGKQYLAVTHDQVTAVLRGKLVEHGILVNQSLISSDITKAGETNNGATITMYTGRYSVSFINIDQPTDFIQLVVEAQALDNSDKASGKAMSYAVKYAMLKTFSLETGENEEGRQPDLNEAREAKETIDKGSMQLLKKLIKDSGSDSVKLLEFYKAESIEKFNKKQFAHALKSLNLKIENQKTRTEKEGEHPENPRAEGEQKNANA